jgi:hypothetical protein
MSVSTQSDSSTRCRALPAFSMAASRNCKSASRTGGEQFMPPKIRINDDKVSASNGCLFQRLYTLVIAFRHPTLTSRSSAVRNAW